MHKEVVYGMLEEMLAPRHTIIDEEFESFDDSNDNGHIIPSLMKKCEDIAINCEDRENVCFSLECVLVSSSIEFMLFSCACKTVFGCPFFTHILPSWAKQIANMSLGLGHQFMSSLSQV